jgi:hypothetical protein
MCELSAIASDETLAARAKSGCRDCFSRLYERYRMTLVRYLHESFVYDFDTALDLEAEAWPCAPCKRKVADDTCPDCGAKRP